MREIVLDTETTGFDPNKGDKIVEIGALELIDKVYSGKNFHVYINPDRDMPEGAFEVHGLSTEFLSDKPLFADIADDFLEFVKDSPLVIHNAPFDMKFLIWELKEAKKPFLEDNEIIDTLQIARRKFPNGRNSLDELCKKFNIDNSARTLHGALLDSELLAEVYIELTGSRQTGLDLSSTGTTSSQSNADVSSKVSYTADQNPLLSEEENHLHKQYIKDTIGENAIWNLYK